MNKVEIKELEPLLSEVEIKELEALLRVAIQGCFNSMTDEQIFTAVFDLSHLQD